jgi:predicted dehydrogenase
MGKRKERMESVKIGFIGCGGIAAVHRDRLVRRNDIELVGCCDILPEQAESFAARWRIPIFKDAVSLYDNARPHAVYISVPPFAHGALETEAAARGIHLFVEMPVALDLQTARAISAAIRKAKVLAMVGYCYRYCDLTQQAHRLLAGEVISLATGRFHCGMPEADWWRRREQSGGQIVEQTTHVIDLLLHLCGPVSEVHAMGAHGCMSKIKNFDVDESSVINLRLKTGAVASISSTCILNHPGSMSLEIATPRLCLALTNETLRVREDHKIVEYLNHTDMYEKESELFIHAVQQGKRGGIRSTYADAIKTLRVTLAANESIQTGLPVVL